MTAAVTKRPVGLSVRVPAFGTEAVMVVGRATTVAVAEAVLREEIDAMDRACSRFRPDAELTMLYDRPGEWVKVGELLFEALSVARRAAERTDGVVDPTVAGAMDRLGYDRDFKSVGRDGPPAAAPRPAPGYGVLRLDARRRCARVPAGVRLDLGATAKALAADRVAARVARLGTGVVVGIGGDVSVGGPAPASGWHVGIAADSGAGGDGIDEVVALSSGGLASSSTALRSWVRGGRRLHHIVDPRTGDCAPAYWQLVSVAAASCVEANVASTAAVVWGAAAPARLEAMGLPARLVRHDGMVTTTAGWPAPEVAPDAVPAPAPAAVVAEGPA